MRKRQLGIFVVFGLIALCLLPALYKRFKYSEIRPDIKIFGPILMGEGIARQTVELAQALKDKFIVEIAATSLKKEGVPKQIRSLLRKKYAKEARVVIIEDILWFPHGKIDRFFKRTEDQDQIRFAYTMFESTRIVPEWVLMINLYFDAVIVPDPFLVDAYKNSGVTVPIFHIPLGLDLNRFLTTPLKEEKKEGPFVFAALCSGIERKNLITTIRAFAKALGNDKRARLHINCRTADQEVRDAIFTEITELGCSNICYTEFRLKQDAYLKFFRSVDCLLSLSKGEGFSIQPREAMALGIPVIVTDNTAQSTICQSGLVKVVSSLIKEPRYYFDQKIPCGHQFNCDVDQAALAIGDVYANYAHYLSKGPLMRQWASRYDYSQLTPLYESVVSPKQLILGKSNEVLPNSTIITDSQALYDKYIRVMELPIVSKKLDNK